MSKKHIDETPVFREINRRFSVAYSYPWRAYFHVIAQNARDYHTTVGQIVFINALTLLLAAAGSFLLFWPMVTYDSTPLLLDIIFMMLWFVWIPTASWIVAGHYLRNGTLMPKSGSSSKRSHRNRR